MIDISIYQHEIIFFLKNKINYDKLNSERKGDGNEMCKKIIGKINVHHLKSNIYLKNIELQIDPPPLNNNHPEFYSVNIKLNYEKNSSLRR